MRWEDSNYLEHYGVLGMKWGRRKSRAKSGKNKKTSQRRKKILGTSAAAVAGTAAAVGAYKHVSGKNKTIYLVKKDKSKNENGLSVKEQNKAVNSILDGTRNVTNSGKQIVNAASRIKKSKEKPLDLSNMSDQELRNRINRMQMERQYSDLMSSRTAEGRDYVNNILDIGGGVLGAVGGALGIALAIKKLKE